MKKYKLLLIIILSIAFLAQSCQRCEKKPPKNIPPIDWKNYNETKTIVDNYHWRNCDDHPFGHGETIKVCGWIYLNFDKHGKLQPHFSLTDDPWVENGISIAVSVSPEIMDDFDNKIGACEVTKKCFVSGELLLVQQHTNCCFLSTEIKLCNIDDIYFE